MNEKLIAEFEATRKKALREYLGPSCPNAGRGVFTDIPALIAEVRRLQAVLAEYADENNWAARNDRPYEDWDLWLPNEHGYTRAENALKDGEG